MSAAIGSFITRARHLVDSPGISVTDFINELNEISIGIQWSLTKLGNYQSDVGFFELSKRLDEHGNEYYDPVSHAESTIIIIVIYYYYYKNVIIYILEGNTYLIFPKTCHLPTYYASCVIIRPCGYSRS